MRKLEDQFSRYLEEFLRICRKIDRRFYVIFVNRHKYSIVHDCYFLFPLVDVSNVFCFHYDAIINQMWRVL